MPSPLGHAMAGAITAWVVESRRPRATAKDGTPASSSDTPTFDLSRRSLLAKAERVADLLSPLTVACAVLAVAPDFDVFFHTHRTYSHSLGAAAIVWAAVALVAWRLRLPVLRTATTCAAAYASHVLLDWLGRDASWKGGLMVLWPVSSRFYRSGLDLFLEIAAHRPIDVVALVRDNFHALAREALFIGVPFALMLKRRLGRGVATGIGNQESGVRSQESGITSGHPHPAPES